MEKKQRSQLVYQVLILLSVCSLTLVIFIVMGVFRRPATSHTVKFRVESTGGYAMITYAAGKDEVREAVTVTVPWTKTFHLDSGTEVYLTASNPQQTGKLTCRLSLDNSAWKEQTTTKDGRSVACGGIVP